MTDTFSPEFEAEDDARYAQMAGEEAPEREEDAPAAEPNYDEGDPSLAPVEEAEPAPQRARLTPEQLEERLLQTKTAMKEARREAREVKRQLEELRTQAAAQTPEDPFDAVIAQLREDDEDPLHDIAALKSFLRRLQENNRTEREREQQLSTQQAAFNRHMTAVAEHEADFREDHPDYDTAVAHFRDSVRAELAEQGLSGEELDRTFATTLINLSKQAVERGKNPAEVVYTLAQKRGYAPNAAPPSPKPAAPLDNPSQKLQTLQRGQQAARSLSAVGGKSTGGQLTLSSVANLEGKELLEGYAKLKAQQKRSNRYAR